MLYHFRSELSNSDIQSIGHCASFLRLAFLETPQVIDLSVGEPIKVAESGAILIQTRRLSLLAGFACKQKYSHRLNGCSCR